MGSVSSSPSSGYATNPKGDRQSRGADIATAIHAGRGSTSGLRHPAPGPMPGPAVHRRLGRGGARIGQVLQFEQFLAGDVFQLLQLLTHAALRGRSVSVRAGRARIRVMVRVQDASNGGSGKGPGRTGPCGLPARAADIRIRTARRCRRPCSAGRPACAAGVPIRCAARAGGCRCAAGRWQSLRRTRRHCSSSCRATLRD